MHAFPLFLEFPVVQNVIQLRTRIRSLALVIALLAVPLAAPGRTTLLILDLEQSRDSGCGYVMLYMSFAVTNAVARLARVGLR